MNNSEENRAYTDEDEDYVYEEAEEDDDDEDEDEGLREDIVVEFDDEDEDNEEDEDEEEDDYDEDEDELEDAYDDDQDGEGGPLSLAEMFASGEGTPATIRQMVAIMHALHEGGRRRNRTPSPIPEPNFQTGKELLNSGEFGRVDSACLPSNEIKRNLVQKLWLRELKPRSITPLALGESVLPDNPGKVIAAFSANAYCGGYSEDGSIFASCDRDWKLRIYRTAGSKLIPEKVIQGMQGRWTITDHNVSLDNQWLIYSSLTPYVYLTRTEAGAPDHHHRLDFTTDTEGDYDDDGDTRLWSVRFSGDGREIIAGGQRRIYVYDIESRTVLHSVVAHEDDVNAVCFAEPSSSQVLFSGSDDGLVKVWDRRSMSGGKNSTPSGILVGHAEGITYVTSKGDNRYLASNGKDQKMLLWDLRMMHSKQQYSRLPRRNPPSFDYRMERYRRRKSFKVQGDCSVMSFQGHQVLRTLIRCHFSPMHTTGQRYLYSGSADGMVHIYRLDGSLVRTLDTSAAFDRYLKVKGSPNSQYLARDVSWHPHDPTIISSCSSGEYGYGYGGYQSVGGGLVQHSFTGPGELGSDGSENSDTEMGASPPLPPPPRRRRFLF